MPATKRFDPDAALEKAMLAFWARGYEATSLQDLVDAMGINRASLYATFGDKRALFRSALLHYDQSRRSARLSALERGHAPLDAIRALFESWVEQALGEGDPSGCLMTNTALELVAHDPEIAQVVASSQRDIEIFFHRLLVQARINGELGADFDAQAGAQALLASLLGLLVLARSRPEQSLLQAVATQAMNSLHTH